jgi:lysozyme family protein
MHQPEGVEVRHRLGHLQRPLQQRGQVDADGTVGAGAEAAVEEAALRHGAQRAQVAVLFFQLDGVGGGRALRGRGWGGTAVSAE